MIGSGIKAVGQFTLQAQAHIRQADIVLYAASDPVTDIWIRQQNPNSFDLYQYYADDKARLMTYVQMIERIMDEVRAGKHVCALFYGHPGVFVTPSHNAIKIARDEGYDAVMLPAVSAEDCLYADLGVDPSVPGLQIYEATDFLIRRRNVDTSVNLVLFQVGCVGELGFKFGGYVNDKFNVLLDYLEDIYGPDHIVVNYVANVFAGDPVIDRHTLAEYRNPDIARKVTGVSTFFIEAARTEAADPEMSEKLGLKSVGPGRNSPLICHVANYPELATRARSSNWKHQAPPGYKYSHASEALYQTLLDLMLSPDALRAFRADPNGFVHARPGLSAEERRKLLIQHHGVTRMMFKRDPLQEATRFVGAALLDPRLAHDYRDKLNAVKQSFDEGNVSPAAYECDISEWLIDKGYATTPSAVRQATKEVYV
ncbi:SAM-dependent methyltransferase [Dyella choica]|uniref:SAM-dependent methyltransferase n=1 Tax=Dyella choica TaxID=1927959 RepID=UPI001E6441BB|nr:SAM-dependent methyltransferase [Dyella choica]